jgi:hypothetical protein
VPQLVFCCRSDNDLCCLLSPNGDGYPRFDAPEDAIDSTPPGGGLLILADAYPGGTTDVDEELLGTGAKNQIRVYVEYPGPLTGMRQEPSRKATWERGIVSSDAFGASLQELRILDLHGCHFIPADADDPLISIGRVAGFDTAPYGLPDETFPLLFRHPRHEVLIATTKLSNFVSARSPFPVWNGCPRYAPPMTKVIPFPQTQNWSHSGEDLSGSSTRTCS